MADIGCRVLCTADIHVGRVSSRLGDAERHEHTCAAVVDRLVEAALRLRVDVVAIAGDLVDHDNRFFEAFGPLLAGLKRLASENIDVVAVSGNHDWDVLPRLAAQLPSLHLLGAGGDWETRTLLRNGRPLLNVVGRCFTAEVCREDPLTGLETLILNGAPTLGLLHADLDQPASRYAPVSLASLHAQPVSLWLLGHIHASRCERRTGCPHVLYPGSPQAMDPGERGPHGPWLAEFNGSDVTLRPWPLSSVRYESFDVDLSEVEEAERFEGHLLERVRSHLQSIDPDWSGVRRCVCRIVLTGRTGIFHDLPELTKTICEQFELPMSGGMNVCIDDIRIDAQPRIDLHALATQSDVVGELARLIVALDRSDNAASADLLQTAVAQVNDLCNLPIYAALPAQLNAPPAAEDIRFSLLRQSRRMLDVLLLQRGCA